MNDDLVLGVDIGIRGAVALISRSGELVALEDLPCPLLLEVRLHPQSKVRLSRFDLPLPLRLDKEKFAADWAQLAYDRKEWAERCADIEAQAHRYRESMRVDIDMSNPSHMARLHSGGFARVGQFEEARAARRSPADVAAELAVAETPEFESVKGTSITRGGGAGRRGS
jgi:hypothetical protein